MIVRIGKCRVVLAATNLLLSIFSLGSHSASIRIVRSTIVTIFGMIMVNLLVLVVCVRFGAIVIVLLVGRLVPILL